MLVEIATPFLIVEHTCEDYKEHTFEVREVPEDPNKLLERSERASTVLRTFQGLFDNAKNHCQVWLNAHYTDSTIIWTEKDKPIEAMGKE